MVNVILVDFRGFDTLGEITVLALAASASMPCWTVCACRARSQDAGPRLGPGRASRSSWPRWRACCCRWPCWSSVFILLRGHNLPGGGFIAGLVTAVALIMQYLANGVAWTHARLPGQTCTR